MRAFPALQFFQVNTNGCMKVIRERRLKQTELFRAVMTNAQKPPQVLGPAAAGGGTQWLSEIREVICLAPSDPD